MLTQKVFDTIDKNCLLNKGDRVLVALSGGADSVSLLVALKNIGKYKLYAAHLNHGIRGIEADRDENFCRELCSSLEIEFFCEKADVPSIAKKAGLSLETCAREVRYAFLSRIADKTNSVIATAHNADDNTETLIMNICRGAGLDGLRGIPIKRDNIIRPLLYASRDEIIAFLEKEGQDYVCDSTNFEADCTRNIIRLNIIPKIKELYPNVTEAVARMTKNLTEDSEFLNAAADESYTLDAESINRLPTAIKKRILFKICKEKFGVSPETVHINELIRLCREKTGISALPKGIFLTVSKGKLVLFEKSAIPDASLPIGNDFFWGDYKISSKIQNFDEELCRKINNSESFACFDCDIISDSIIVRQRRDGDKIFIAKRNITKSLKKLLNECSISPNERDSIPVIAAGNVILWVYGAAKSGRFPPKKHGRMLILSIENKRNDD